LPPNRRVLRKNGDATFALERTRIHHTLWRHFARIERTGLSEELIDEGGLAMIDVRDDGDITEI
jgi:hypothetical protein